MVSKPAKERATVVPFFIALIATVLLAGFFMVYPFSTGKTSEPEITEPENGSGAENGGGDHGGGANAVVLPEKIDLQPVVNEWISSISGRASVMIYDLDRNEIIGEYNSTELFNTASLYKLFLVYEGYRRLESGEWNADDIAGSTGLSILECLDLSIRESYSPCAETLWAMIGHEELDNIITSDFGITGSYISGITSNANDIVEMMKIFYHHTEISNPTYIEKMKDSFLNQPITTYNWRQGLPSGFSDKILVYNKVGWDYDVDGEYWNLYHDAAILDVPSLNRHFIVVEMTHAVSLDNIKNLAARIEAALNI